MRSLIVVWYLCKNNITSLEIVKNDSIMFHSGILLRLFSLSRLTSAYKFEPARLFEQEIVLDYVIRLLKMIHDTATLNHVSR